MVVSLSKFTNFNSKNNATQRHPHRIVLKTLFGSEITITKVHARTSYLISLTKRFNAGN